MYFFMQPHLQRVNLGKKILRMRSLWLLLSAMNSFLKRENAGWPSLEITTVWPLEVGLLLKADVFF